MNRIEQLIEELCPEGVEWKELGKVCSIFDGTHQTPKYTNEGVKFVSVENIKDLYSTKKYISNDDFENLYKIKPQLNDVFMTRIGTIGACAIVDRDEELAFYVTLTLLRPNQDIVISKFVRYYIESSNGQKELRKRTLVNAVPIKINLGEIGKISIPIPPLPIQQEIINILDKFTALDASLQAELEARRKQYEHYRNQLLNFEGKDVEWKMLGEIGNIQRGVRVVRNQLLESGKYPVYQNSMKPLGYFDKKNFKANTTFIISAGAAGDIGYSDVDFWAADDCFLCLCPDNLKSKFLYYFLLCNQNYLYSRVRRASVPRLSRDVVEKIKIPLPPLSEQERIVGILDKFDALVNTELPAEIAARRKQYEYYREKLLTFEPLAN